MLSSAENKPFENFSHEELIALARTQQSLIATLRVERDYYKEQFQAKLRALYAARSEAKANTKQADLFFNEAEVLARQAPELEATESNAAASARAKKKRGRKPLDANLPRIVERIELPQAERVCAHDGAALIEIGVEASEQLDIIPAQIRVIRTERVKYACPCCQGHLKTAPLPAKVIDKGLFTANALAWIISAKYQDALPLYRQAALLARLGGELNRNTLATSVLRCGQAAQPLINLLRDHLLEAAIVHGDETELQVLKEDGRPAQSKSWLWLQLTDEGPPIRLFTYAPSRSSMRDCAGR